MWREPGNRRKLFELYAKQHAFDPLLAENWYQQPVESFMSMKVNKARNTSILNFPNIFFREPVE